MDTINHAAVSPVSAHLAAHCVAVAIVRYMLYSALPTCILYSVCTLPYINEKGQYHLKLVDRKIAE